MVTGQEVKVEQQANREPFVHVSAPVPVRKFFVLLLALTGIGVSALVICL